MTIKEDIIDFFIYFNNVLENINTYIEDESEKFYSKIIDLNLLSNKSLQINTVQVLYFDFLYYHLIIEEIINLEKINLENIKSQKKTDDNSKLIHIKNKHIVILDRESSHYKNLSNEFKVNLDSLLKVIYEDSLKFLNIITMETEDIFHIKDRLEKLKDEFDMYSKILDFIKKLQLYIYRTILINFHKTFVFDDDIETGKVNYKVPDNKEFRSYYYDGDDKRNRNYIELNSIVLKKIQPEITNIEKLKFSYNILGSQIDKDVYTTNVKIDYFNNKYIKKLTKQIDIINIKFQIDMKIFGFKSYSFSYSNYTEYVDKRFKRFYSINQEFQVFLSTFNLTNMEILSTINKRLILRAWTSIHEYVPKYLNIINSVNYASLDDTLNGLNVLGPLPDKIKYNFLTGNPFSTDFTESNKMKYINMLEHSSEFGLCKPINYPLNFIKKLFYAIFGLRNISPLYENILNLFQTYSCQNIIFDNISDVYYYDQNYSDQNYSDIFLIHDDINLISENFKNLRQENPENPYLGSNIKNFKKIMEILVSISQQYVLLRNFKFNITILLTIVSSIENQFASFRIRLKNFYSIKTDIKTSVETANKFRTIYINYLDSILYETNLKNMEVNLNKFHQIIRSSTFAEEIKEEEILKKKKSFLNFFKNFKSQLKKFKEDIYVNRFLTIEQQYTFSGIGLNGLDSNEKEVYELFHEQEKKDIEIFNEKVKEVLHFQLDLPVKMEPYYAFFNSFREGNVKSRIGYPKSIKEVVEILSFEKKINDGETLLIRYNHWVLFVQYVQRFEKFLKYIKELFDYAIFFDMNATSNVTKAFQSGGFLELIDFVIKENDLMNGLFKRNYRNYFDLFKVAMNKIVFEMIHKTDLIGEELSDFIRSPLIKITSEKNPFDKLEMINEHIFIWNQSNIPPFNLIDVKIFNFEQNLEKLTHKPDEKEIEIEFKIKNKLKKNDYLDDVIKDFKTEYGHYFKISEKEFDTDDEIESYDSESSSEEESSSISFEKEEEEKKEEKERLEKEKEEKEEKEKEEKERLEEEKKEKEEKEKERIRIIKEQEKKKKEEEEEEEKRIQIYVQIYGHTGLDDIWKKRLEVDFTDENGVNYRSNITWISEILYLSPRILSIFMFLSPTSNFEISLRGNIFADFLKITGK